MAGRLEIAVQEALDDPRQHRNDHAEPERVEHERDHDEGDAGSARLGGHDLRF